MKADTPAVQTILDALPIGVLLADGHGKVQLLNPALARLLDLPAGTAPGRPLAEYISDEGLCRRMLEVSRGKLREQETAAAYEFVAGNQRYLLARLCPLPSSGEDLPAVLLTLVDITAVKVLDRLKNEFVAKVSHELRSPLSTIHEQLALVMSDVVGQVSPADEHLLSRAKEKTQGLIYLIGDLLDLSRIESGVVCKTLRPVVLDELLENIIDFLGTRAAAKQQHLTLTLPKGSLPPIKADPLALESIFGNLITNAINYTPEGGHIEVKVIIDSAQLQVDVADTGFGIEARHLSKIFERFYRIKNEKTRYVTGTGLGLPIVKGLVESLGGSIQVHSTPDQGSTFSVRLPVNSR
jgi:two-component system phosphate regulon sensor histidine kinase PhoR